MTENTPEAACMLESRSRYAYDRDANVLTLEWRGVTTSEVKTAGRARR
jgi:hypothetical protein